MQYDVALLKLTEPVALDQRGFINAICLPNKDRSLPVGSVCMAAGWGKIGTFSFPVDFSISSNQRPYPPSDCLHGLATA